MLNIYSYIVNIFKGDALILSFITETQDSWDYLKSCNKPIFIYGMGDGALKIMSVMRKKGIAFHGIFASDEFVRGHFFEGYKVHTLAEVERSVEDFVIVLAFAAGYSSLVEKIRSISSCHTLIAPDVPVVFEEDGDIFTLSYCKEHEKELSAVYEMLADDASRKVFSDIINFKISGKISYLDSCTSEKDEVYTEIICPSEDEIYVDLGAYRGDTVEEFLRFAGGKYRHIYALEPDRKNFGKMELATKQYENISLYNAAAWGSDTTLLFDSKAGRHSAISSKGKETAARSVDSILNNSPCTIIKMDVEGAERSALLGAKETIAKYRPKLMISLYHRTEDLFSLPLLIKSINPDYRFYLRHQLYIPAWETNLYCV